MKRDFSEVPVEVTIKNTTGDRVAIDLRNTSMQIPSIMENEQEITLKVTTSEALALLTQKVKECGLEMTTSEGGDTPEPEKPTEVTTTEDLKEAIKNGDTEIKLADNITVDSGNLTLGNVEHFDGNGKTITFGST